MSNREGRSSPSAFIYLTHRPHLRVMLSTELDWLLVSGKNDSLQLEGFLLFK